MVKKKKSSQFLRSCIFEALMILLQQKRYEDITVSEITSKAGVSRMTYYRTYSSKEDIIIQYFKEKVNALLGKEPEIGDEPTEVWYRKCLHFVYDEPVLMTKIQQTPDLAKASQSYLIDLLQYMFRKYRNADLDDPVILNGLIYKAGGFIFVVSKWIRTGLKESPEEILEWIRKYEQQSSFEKPQ